MLLFWFFELYSIGKDIKNGLDYQRLSGEEHDSLPCLRLFLLYDVANISNKTDIIGLFCIFVFILPVVWYSRELVGNEWMPPCVGEDDCCVGWERNVDKSVSKFLTQIFISPIFCKNVFSCSFPHIYDFYYICTFALAKTLHYMCQFAEHIHNNHLHKI